MTIPAELAAMQTAQEAHMFDACQVGTVGTTQDAVGELVPGAPSYGAEQACGFHMVSGTWSAEYRTGDGTIVKADAKLRLAHDAAITVTSVVKVTKRYGTAITPLVYEVVGVPAAGPTGTVVYLRAVST
jgi:hypothetical protein